MTKIINILGGPGIGKSTTAAHLFALLKLDGVNCELVQEYAKDKVWEESYKIFSNQIYIFGKQYHRMHRLMDKVDVIVTDSPLMLNMYYGKDSQHKSFRDLIWAVHSNMNNLNVFLERVKPYQEAGRFQKEYEAVLIDQQLKTLMEDYNIPYITVPGDDQAAFKIKEEYRNERLNENLVLSNRP